MKRKHFTNLITLLFLILLSFAALAITKRHSSDKITQTRKNIKRLLKQAPNLKPKVLKLALTAYEKAQEKGLVHNPKLTVIDYSLPSNQKRMWVFDLKRGHVLFHTHVAHGSNSGMTKATQFSNRPGSKQSSIGTFLTGKTYNGGKGYSLNLQGLEKGLNDNAYRRRIVIHGAHYMSKSFIDHYGRSGRSWGCPAVKPELVKPLINKIKGGSVIFSYYPNQHWLTRSYFLKNDILA